MWPGPSDYYSSFFALGLDRDTAGELAEVARLRNMLVHQYEDVRPEQVHQAALHSASLWRVYIGSERL
ncbi:MAG: HepT-like ribonuclease domain-containing protein [Candidatus Eremiobacterota bacterium]